jgi:hypothetical protein
LFVSLKRNGDRMNETEREELVAYWLEAELNEAEDYRALAGPMSDDYREGQLVGLSIMADEAYEALLGNDYRKIEKDADALLRAERSPHHHRTMEDALQHGQATQQPWG